MRKMNREQKLMDDREFLDRVQSEIDRQDNIKMRSSNILKNEFLFFNDQKQIDNRKLKEQSTNIRHEEKYDHFPFVSGEILTKHR